MSEHILYNTEEIAGALYIMATDIIRKYPEAPVLVGIRRGGVTVAQRLAKILETKMQNPPIQGIIDINLYRDDWTKARQLPKVGRTEIPVSLDDKRVILVDDVLFTGRTVRAALEALNNFGRPLRIELAVLVDRGHREMPIEANYVPFKLHTGRSEKVNIYFKDENRDEDVIVIENN